MLLCTTATTGTSYIEQISIIVGFYNTSTAMIEKYSIGFIVVTQTTFP